MKQASAYNSLVRFYNRSRRKLQTLALQGRNLRKQDILKRRILQLFKKLTGFQHALKLGMATATLSAGMLLFHPNALRAQITFGPLVSNPFGLTDFGAHYAPTFADLDNDGDLDLISGDSGGGFMYFENIGAEEVPSFAAVVYNPFGLSDIGYSSSPTIADLDNDGDMDLMSGDFSGKFKYFENTGTADAPAFADVVTNPFDLTDIGSNSGPSFIDLDGDGDSDLMAGQENFFSHSFNYFENIGTVDAPNFDGVITSPFGLSGGYSAPTFADLDDDGDMDLMSGLYFCLFGYYENIGTSDAPAFTTILVNPFGLYGDGGYNNALAFTDLDHDGDCDLISAASSSYFFYFENITPGTDFCGTPTGLFVDEITSANATLHWDAEEGASAYRVVIWKASDMSNVWKETTLTNSLLIPEGALDPATEYIFRVRSACDFGFTAYSEIYYFTTSAKMGQFNEAFSIYPNPTSTEININLALFNDDQNITIEIYDITGRKIKSFSANTQHIFTIDVSDLSVGVYMLNIYNSHLKVIEKIIIE